MKYIELVKGPFTSEHEKRAKQADPYVAYSIEADRLMFNMIPEPVVYDSYVTFTAEEDNSSIRLVQLSTNQTMEYSTDTTTWLTFNTETNISLNNGGKAYVRGILSANNTLTNYTQFTMSGKIAASGSCNAIWNYQDLNAPLKAFCGWRMFARCGALTAAPELPSTTLHLGCYHGMFDGCTSITTAPVLPATTLVGTCYEGMFNGCTSLNHITCLVTDVPPTNYFRIWVNGVSSTGTFVKHPEATNWTIGQNGIPEGWTVVDAVL